MRKVLLPILLMLVPSIGLAHTAARPKQVAEISETARFRSLNNKAPINMADYDVTATIPICRDCEGVDWFETTISGE